jgi:hypothetical protein
MKKIFISLVMLAISSCSYMKGDYTLGSRNAFNDFFYTYNIRYYDTDSFSNANTETVTVSDYDLGAVRHAVPGGIVVYSKIIRKEIYSDEYVRPTTKGALVSYTVPVEFSDEKVYRAMGEVEINGVTYRLVKPNRIGDILLISPDGEIYPRVGKIYNDRLALLDTQFILEPENVKFVNETKNRFGDEDTVAGFEVRYIGLEDYQMVFSLLTVSPEGGTETEQTKTFKFPMYDKKVVIDGIKLEILGFDDSGIEYKILGI